MDHVEAVLFTVERVLLRCYPSRAAVIQRATVTLAHRGGISPHYCAACMAGDTGINVVALYNAYADALREAEAEEAARQQVIKDRKRAIMWSVYSLVMLAVAFAVTR